MLGLQVSGIVRSSDIAGKLPTKDAVIEWQLVKNPTVLGQVITNADGEFRIDIQVLITRMRLDCLAVMRLCRSFSLSISFQIHTSIHF